MVPRRQANNRTLAAALSGLAREPLTDAGVVRRRVFVVGCPRSGTTLLQSLLHAHSDIHSLPETHFFQHLLASEESRMCGADDVEPRRHRRECRRRTLAAAGWVVRRRARRAWQALAAAGLAIEPPRGIEAWRLRAHARAFTAAMDRACRARCTSVWVEKTPDHLFYIAAIQALIPDARFLHVVRDGAEVAASLHHAARQYAPWRPFLDVERCVDRWERATTESLRWLDDPLHRLVRYEDLVASPQSTLRGVLNFIGCRDDAGLWQRYPRSATELIAADEPWKQGNLQPITPRRQFEAVFDDAQQQRVHERLASFAPQITRLR
ncbi:sulfotransferase [Lysobacter sp.]|uniref:sulfotransferase family protein n=1 Tax=Lysobacter sp. TaxID=72226 RepID=UPI002D4DA21C|nr:sulfotransferase [Lysobacter sp.]HZX76375.1 sulfotransferase [Lysobacter sp.]